MRQSLATWLATGVMLLLVPALLIPLIAVKASPVNRSDYIVTLRPGLAVDTAVNGLGVKLGFTAHHLYRHALHGFAATLSDSQVAALRKDTRVRTIQPDRSVKALAEILPTGVEREQGDQSSTRSGDGKGSVNIDVAVIDTGIDARHPDLNVVGGTNCSDGGTKNYADGNGHGTHVAGIIAAKDDNSGVVGVAPGARLWAVRVLDKSGSGTFSSLICGIDWVAAHAVTIKVANMSLGGFGTRGSCTDGSIRQAICSATKAGVTFVVAAGNSGADFGGSSGLPPFVPASFPEVLTVTAMADFNGQAGGGAPATCRADVDDTYADFSNYAVSNVDIAHTISAPGVCIQSTWLGGGYKTISGTSMASPHVAGTAALCIATGRCTGGPAQVTSKLLADAAARPSAYGFAGDPVSSTGKAWWKSGTGHYYGYLVYAGAY
jgi:subtilisin